LEVTAVSLHAYAYLADRYALLAHGASVGDGYGPRIVARGPRPADPQAALGGESLLVAVPGELTTAFLALKLYQPAARHVVVPFDQIEEYVAAGRAEAGLLIHEGQLTYADRGLHLWVDLGEWWHAETGLPLPLGGNVVRRDLGQALMRDIARDLKASIQYGLAHRSEALAYAKGYSRRLGRRGAAAAQAPSHRPHAVRHPHARDERRGPRARRDRDRAGAGDPHAHGRQRRDQRRTVHAAWSHGLPHQAGRAGRPGPRRATRAQE